MCGGTPELARAVTVPDALTWRPAYIRLPKISVLGNRAFTIASVPASKEDKLAELVLLVRAQVGFNALANMVERSSTALPATGSGTPTALASPVSPGTAITLDLDLEKAASDNCASCARVAALRTLVWGC